MTLEQFLADIERDVDTTESMAGVSRVTRITRQLLAIIRVQDLKLRALEGAPHENIMREAQAQVRKVVEG